MPYDADNWKEPVSPDEVRFFMRRDEDETWDDDLIASLIEAQRQAMEIDLGIALVKRTVTENYRGTPCCGYIAAWQRWKPKYGPVSGLEAKLIDGTPVTPDNYGSAEWPVLLLSYNADITYTAGYNTVPEPLKTALKMRVSTLYQNRENVGGEARAAFDSRKLERLYDRNIF